MKELMYGGMISSKVFQIMWTRSNGFRRSTVYFIYIWFDGKPKGMVHTCAGYMVYAAYTFLNVFQYKEGDIYWCTADIGWITGHSYMIYGPMAVGATSVHFEGIPSYPNWNRFWKVCEK